MQIIQFYSARFKRTVYKTDFSIKGKRYRQIFFTEEEARKAMEARISLHRDREWLILPTNQDFEFGWCEKAQSLPEIAACYAIFPEPIWKKVLYAGQAQNLRAPFLTKTHPWHQIIGQYERPWIVYFAIGKAPERTHFERLISRIRNPKIDTGS